MPPRGRNVKPQVYIINTENIHRVAGQLFNFVSLEPGRSIFDRIYSGEISGVCPLSEILDTWG